MDKFLPESKYLNSFKTCSLEDINSINEQYAQERCNDSNFSSSFSQIALGLVLISIFSFIGYIGFYLGNRQNNIKNSEDLIYERKPLSSSIPKKVMNIEKDLEQMNIKKYGNGNVNSDENENDNDDNDDDSSNNESNSTNNINDENGINNENNPLNDNTNDNNNLLNVNIENDQNSINTDNDTNNSEHQSSSDHNINYEEYICSYFLENKEKNDQQLNNIPCAEQAENENYILPPYTE